jgi:hypothetical protein
MPGSTGVRALAAGGGLWAMVTSVAADEYAETALASGLQDLDWVGERAMAHESVVEHFLGAAAVLPMQLFTLFTSDARAIDHVARDRARIDRIVARIERQLEFGLRLSLDADATRAAVDAGGRRSGQERASAVSGASYLVRKRDLLHVSRAQLAAARAEANRLYRAMSREATDARRRTAMEQGVPGSRVLLDAAFLVPARQAGAFRSALRQHTRKLAASGLVVSLTGPWPAYNFIDKPARAAKPTARRKAASPTAGRRPRSRP